MSEQINSPGFFPFVDYIWSPREDYDYVLSVIQQFPHLKLFTPERPPESDGIIFMGMNTLQEDCLASIPDRGKYIVISRDNDRPFTEDHYKLKKDSIKHIYTVNCSVRHEDVTAIPLGHRTITGFSENLESVARCTIGLNSNHAVLCRLNTNESTDARKKAIESLQHNKEVLIIEDQMYEAEFYIFMKTHMFCLALEGGGKDTLRTWEALYLQTIPIVSDCIEMRHFEDMPIAFYPECGCLTKEWLMETAERMFAKKFDRSLMTYWRKEIVARKAEL